MKLKTLVLLIIVLTISCKEDSIPLYTYVTFYHQNLSYDEIRVEVDGNIVGFIHEPNAIGTIECATLGPDRVTIQVNQGQVYHLEVFQGQSSIPFIDGNYKLLSEEEECINLRIK